MPLCLGLHACLICLSLIVMLVLDGPSLKAVSHLGAFLSAAAADKNTASRALVILKSSNGEKESSIGEYQQCPD